MKKTVFFMLSVFASVSIMAQDKIVTKEGETIIGYGTEVGATSIFYREKADEKAPTLKVAKEQVLMVKYKNGDKQMMDDDAETAVSTSASSHQQATSEDMSIPTAENDAMMARYMPEVTYTGKAKGKNTQNALCLLAFTKGSVIADKNIEIIYKPGDALRGNWIDFFVLTEKEKGLVGSLMTPYIPVGNTAYKLSIKNRTNKTVFLDLANTFFLRGSNAVAYYVPTATTNTSSSTTGASVNMGAVAGALGVGGAVGKLANGVNVGGGTTNGQSTTVFSQRYVSVAPMSTLELQQIELFPDGLNDAYNFGGKRYTVNNNAWSGSVGARLPITDITVGGTITYEETSSPITIGSLVTYSLTEDFSQPYTVLSRLFVRKIIGCSGVSGGGASIKFSNLSENVRQSLCIGALIEK